MEIMSRTPDRCATRGYRIARCVREGGHDGQHGYALADVPALAAAMVEEDAAAAPTPPQRSDGSTADA